MVEEVEVEELLRPHPNPKPAGVDLVTFLLLFVVVPILRRQSLRKRFVCLFWDG